MLPLAKSKLPAAVDRNVSLHAHNAAGRCIVQTTDLYVANAKKVLKRTAD